MKRILAFLAASILCACCLGLAACGGSSSSSATSGSASTSASESSSAASSSEASASASASSSASASDEVSPELKEAAEKLVALADEEAALAEKGKAEGYDAIKAEWEELSKQITEVTNALKPWAEKYADGTISDADKAFYDTVVVPALSKSASAGLAIVDLIEY